MCLKERMGNAEADRNWFKSYSNQEGSFFVRGRAIHRIQRLRLTDKKTDSAETVVDSASSRTAGLAPRGSSYTKEQMPMHSDKEPLGSLQHNGPGLLLLCVGAN